MHVLLTGNTSFKIANFRRGLVRFLLEQGCSVSTLVPVDPWTAELEALGCRIFPLRMNRKGIRPDEEIQLLGSFRRSFAEVKPDAVLGFTIKNNIYGSIAAEKQGIPFFPNVTGMGSAFERHGIRRLAVRYLYRRAFRATPAVFFQNREDRAFFIENRIIEPDRTRVVPGSGVDLENFSVGKLPGGGQDTVFLMVSRMLPAKGVREFCAAAGRLRSAYPSASFRLLGPLDPGNPTAITDRELEHLTKSNAVEYLGDTRDVRPYIGLADCVVLPSYYKEGTPRALIEAAAMGRPVITVDTAGCRDVVEDCITGFVCIPKNTDSLAEGMCRFLAMPSEERVRMGLNGRQKVETEYDEKIVIEAYWRELAPILAGSITSERNVDLALKAKWIT